jgi:N-acetylmuramoyl-L-alanine amidase
MRVRPWLVIAAGVCVLPIVVLSLPLPLPRALDPRAEEVPAGRYAELARFADLRTRGQVEADLRAVDPHGALAPYLTLTDAALEVRLAAGDRQPAVRVRLRAAPLPARSAAEAPRRVALDPGHWGGSWSRNEQRQTARDGGPVVREGDLTWGTARLIERDLLARGVAVRLLRGPPPQFGYAGDADPAFDLRREARFWLAENHRENPASSRGWWSGWRTPFSLVRLWWAGRRFARESPFELFTHYELRRRAAAAEAFAPDVTLSVHYNFTRSNRSGILVFVPGNFLPDELVTASQRFWALRHVVDGSLEETHRLASTLAAAMMRKLDLPALGEPEATGPFPEWLPVDAAHGVYARNLAVLRRAPGVCLLAEGPPVNQTEEYRRLQDNEVEMDGQRYPTRVRQYADAVLEALQAPP